MNMNKFWNLEKIIFFLSGLLFFVPLIIWRNSSYPFISYKAFTIQFLALLIAFVYFLLLLSKFKKARPWWSWLGFVVLCFEAVILISSWTGVNELRSWWSREERMTGLFLVSHYFLLYAVWRSVLNKEQWVKLWKFFVLLGSVVLFIALLQVVKPDLLLNLGSERIGSTLGNPVFLAGYSTFLFFSYLYFLYTDRRRITKWFWIGLAALSVAVVFFTQTRGDMIGLYLGILFLLSGALYIRFNYLSSRQKKYSLAVIVVLLATPFLLFFLRESKIIKSVPGLGRLFSTPLEQSTGGTRLIMWEVALKGWQERRLLGWGWENYYDLANKHYDPRLLRYGHGEEWTDNAHNVILNTLATTGIVGLAFYTAIYIFIFFSLFRKFRGFEGDKQVLALLLGAFIFSHFTRNVFVFEDLSSYLVLFWLLSGTDIIFNKGNSVQTLPINSRSSSRHFLLLKRALQGVLVLAAFFSLAMLFYRFTYIPFKADQLAVRAVNKSMTDFKTALEIHRSAIKIDKNPYRPDIAFDYGQFMLVWLSNNRDFPFTDYRALAMEMYEVGAKALGAHLSTYPNDPRAGMILARAYLDGYEFWQNPSYLLHAETVFKQSLQFSPRRQTLYYGLIDTKRAQQNYKEALKLAEEVLSLDKEVAESYWYVAKIYSDLGKNDEAYKYAKIAEEKGYQFSHKDLAIAFKLFLKANDGETLAGRVERSIRQSSRPNPVLLEDYTQYLISVNKTEEAGYWKSKFGN